MSTIFIIHGTGGSPQENWFPWLKLELEQQGHRVVVPAFPTPEKQSLKNWRDVFRKYEQYLGKDTLLVGHSLGCAFLLSVLEKQQAKATFLVAGFLKKLNKPEFIESNKTFVEKEFDWTAIRNNCRKFYVLNSDNDPHVPLENGKELARLLGTECMVISQAGHFNKDAGFTRFELLLELMQKEL